MNIDYFKSGETWNSILSDEICYIQENNDMCKDCIYTKGELVEMCGGDELKAEVVFGLLSWQSPSAVLGEWDEDDDKALEELREDRRCADEIS